MPSLSLGYSPCPNDTFIFYALVHGIINREELHFDEVLLDVEALNRKALNAELDITKLSYHAFGHLRDKYCLLRSGSALGRGCGPLIISKNNYSIKDLRNKKIAIPGRMTTAYMLLQLCDSAFRYDPSRILVLPFNRIMDAIANGEADAGLIIHESRFTYPDYGLQKVIDLGDWWERETGLPIPLGGIAARRTLGTEIILSIDSLLKQSIQYALDNREAPDGYIKMHAQELADEVVNQHIGLYVNEFSIDIGEAGINAVNTLFTMAEESGIIPRSQHPLFANS